MYSVSRDLRFFAFGLREGYLPPLLLSNILRLCSYLYQHRLVDLHRQTIFLQVASAQQLLTLRFQENLHIQPNCVSDVPRRALATNLQAMQECGRETEKQCNGFHCDSHAIEVLQVRPHVLRYRH